MIDQPETEEQLREKVFQMGTLARDVLGYDLLTSLHMGWFYELVANKNLLFLAPRDHFKTTCITEVYPVFRIINNRAIRILLVNEILQNGKDFLREIKENLQSESFKNVFGDLTRGNMKWSETSIHLKSDRVNKDPTISVAGTMGTINSKHVDLIIVDDPVSIKNSATLAQRKKLMRWFRETLFPILAPNGQMIVTGTRWHFDDMYGEMLKRGNFNNWRKIVLTAIDKEGKVLFPERFTLEKFAELKENMTTPFFNSQYMNDPSGMEGNSLKWEWIKWYTTCPAIDQMKIYQGVDLAISKKEGAAYFAHVTIGVPAEGDIYVLDIHRERLDFPSQCKIIKAKARLYNPIVCAIENNSYQEAMPQWLRSDPEAKRLPIKGVPSCNDKIAEISSMGILFSNGVIRIKDEHESLVDEYLTFPNGSTFDVLDALKRAVDASHEHAVEPRIVEVNL